MKNIHYLIIISLIALVSCDVLDVEPMHYVTAEDAITTKKDVEIAVMGCYDAFQSAGYYGRNFIVSGDLAADVLNWSGTTAGYNQIDNNSILADNVIVESIWSSIYTSVNRINNVIAKAPLVDELTEDELNSAMAEMYFLRALSHHNLVKLFGPVPIRLLPTTNSEEDFNVPRMPIDAVYAQIFSDLALAEENIDPIIRRGRASKAAVLALKARASLDYYYISNEGQRLVDANEAASKVISDFNLLIEPDFYNLFNGSPNHESIFEIEFNIQDRNRLAEYFFPTALSGRNEFTPTDTLFDSYAINDSRKGSAIIGSLGGSLYVKKYNDIETGTDNVYVFRLAEMHLIRAEANALREMAVSLIIDDVNAIRERAGLDPLSTTDFSELLDEIELQRMKEFAFEGHRWFDLVRTGRAIDVLENVNHIDQTLFPIPLNEILANSHSGMYQNDGY